MPNYPGWFCNACGHKNQGHWNACQMCSADNPNITAPPLTLSSFTDNSHQSGNSLIDRLISQISDLPWQAKLPIGFGALFVVASLITTVIVTDERRPKPSFVAPSAAAPEEIRITPAPETEPAPTPAVDTIAEIAAPAPRVSSGTKRGGHQYIRGSRGGCYYINGKGNKTYVSRSACD